MSVKYKLVLKKDLTQGATADAKRYYASAPVSGMMDFDSICELIAERRRRGTGCSQPDSCDGRSFTPQRSCSTWKTR